MNYTNEHQSRATIAHQPSSTRVISTQQSARNYPNNGQRSDYPPQQQYQHPQQQPDTVQNLLTALTNALPQLIQQQQPQQPVAYPPYPPQAGHYPYNQDQFPVQQNLYSRTTFNIRCKDRKCTLRRTHTAKTDLILFIVGTVLLRTMNSTINNLNREKCRRKPAQLHNHQLQLHKVGMKALPNVSSLSWATKRSQKQITIFLSTIFLCR